MAKEVKRHPITKCIMVAVLFGCLGFLLSPKAIMAACSPDSPTITNSSGFFWGYVTTNVGDVVRAYDDSVTTKNGCVGECSVTLDPPSGSTVYSMSVYEDDGITPEQDGVKNGDTIRFKICSSGTEYNCTQIVTWDHDTYSSNPTQRDLVANSTPIADFSATPTSGCASLTVNFTNSSTGATSYSWTFGDGSAANTAPSPSHSYTAAGTYTVTLTATNSSGNTIQTKTNLITVGLPVAAFSADTTSGCAPLTVNFTNTSTRATSYSWNFGDGSAPVITDMSPYPHAYTTPGTYTVTLTASNACGPMIQTKTNLITVTSVATPVPLFDECGKILLFFSLMISFCWGITKQRKMS